MRSLRLTLAVLAIAAAGACKGTDPPAQVPGNISITRGNNQRAVVGELVPDSVIFKVLDVESAPIPNIRVNFTASAGTLASPSALTNASGLVAMPALTAGPNEETITVTASVDGSPSITVAAAVNAVISFYAIQLNYINAGTASQRAVFEEAVRRWRGIISSELTDVQVTIEPGDCGTAPAFSEIVDDLVIFVDLVNIDGPGGVLGSAGPCFIRSSNQLTIAGLMRFDTSDLPTLEARGQLDEVVMHEMGHVVGIGSLWAQPPKNLRDNTDPADPIFTGLSAQNAFLSPAVGGTSCACRAVPIESSGGGGTALVHWRESVMGRELMTGFLQPTGSNPLSIVTLTSLQDLGYQIRSAKAEPYSITIGALMGDFVQTQQPLRLVEAEIKSPIKEVDANGRVLRVHPRGGPKE